MVAKPLHQCPAQLPWQPAQLLQLACAAGEQLLLPFLHIHAGAGCGPAAVATPYAVHLLEVCDGASGPAEEQHVPLKVRGTLALPQSPAERPITALAVSPCGRLLALSCPSALLELYDCTSLTMLEWPQKAAGLAAKLDQLAGHVHHVCFRPGDAPSGAGSLLLASHTHVCHVCLESVKTGVPLDGAGIVKPVRSTGRPVFVGDAAGAAVRVMHAGGVVLGAGWVSRESFLLAQGSWDAAAQQLPAPLLLKLYGS
jgi:hypothetical protein